MRTDLAVQPSPAEWLSEATPIMALPEQPRVAPRKGYPQPTDRSRTEVERWERRWKPKPRGPSELRAAAAVAVRWREAGLLHAVAIKHRDRPLA